MKSFWLFAKQTGDGSEGDASRPDLPEAGQRWTSPGDVVRLTGPVASPHRHLLVGGIALPDDNLGDGHRHYVLRLDNGNWAQVTEGAVNHTHTLRINVAGRLLPDYFMLFWSGSDADAVAIANHPGCYPIVEAEMSQDDDGNWSVGDLDTTAWTAGQRTTWENRCLDVLGIQLPPEVDRGKRLVQIFLGCLLSRQTDHERGYRFS